MLEVLTLATLIGAFFFPPLGVVFVILLVICNKKAGKI